MIMPIAVDCAGVYGASVQSIPRGIFSDGQAPFSVLEKHWSVRGECMLNPRPGAHRSRLSSAGARVFCSPPCHCTFSHLCVPETWNGRHATRVRLYCPNTGAFSAHRNLPRLSPSIQLEMDVRLKYLTRAMLESTNKNQLAHAGGNVHAFVKNATYAAPFLPSEHTFAFFCSVKEIGVVAYFEDSRWQVRLLRKEMRKTSKGNKSYNKLRKFILHRTDDQTNQTTHLRERDY